MMISILRDLSDPSEAIPKGTLAAIFSTMITYLIYVVMTGSVAVRYASGDIMEFHYGQFTNETSDAMFEEANVTQAFDDCITPTDRVDARCGWGIAVQQQMMELISAWGPLIYAGCFAATLSSTISSLEGAPRVLQALAKDDVFPYLKTFSIGHGRNNDPIRGYIAVFAISLICILIADLNFISSLLRYSTC